MNTTYMGSDPCLIHSETNLTSRGVAGMLLASLFKTQGSLWQGQHGKLSPGKTIESDELVLADGNAIVLQSHWKGHLQLWVTRVEGVRHEASDNATIHTRLEKSSRSFPRNQRYWKLFLVAPSVWGTC